MEKESRPLFDFAVISESWDDVSEVPKTLGEAADGESILRRERLFRSTDEDFGHEDDQIGVLYLEERRSVETSEVVCRGVFQFANGDSLTASGALPEKSTDGGASVDSGTLGIVGGAGTFKRSWGQLAVQVQNPKRWTAEGLVDDG